MAILNYTTQISTDKTIGEIQVMLARAGAQAVLTEFDQGVLSSVSFRIATPEGLLSFRLPAEIAAVSRILERDRKVPRKLQTREQAARVAWRIIKDWLAAQLALLETRMVTIDQLFLPYIQRTDGRTLYEHVKASGFKQLALPSPS